MGNSDDYKIIEPASALYKALQVTRSNYRRSAYKDSREFKLSDNAVDDLLVSSCVYCGHLGDERWFHSVQRRRKVRYKAVLNGIDRVDNALGYVSGNVVSCCRNCNYAKGKLSLEEFTKWLDRLVLYRQNLPTKFALSSSGESHLGGSDAETWESHLLGSGAPAGQDSE